MNKCETIDVKFLFSFYDQIEKEVKRILSFDEHPFNLLMKKPFKDHYLQNDWEWTFYIKGPFITCFPTHGDQIAQEIVTTSFSKENMAKHILMNGYCPLKLKLPQNWDDEISKLLFPLIKKAFSNWKANTNGTEKYILNTRGYLYFRVNSEKNPFSV